MSNAAATTTVTTRHHVVKQSSLDKGERQSEQIGSLKLGMFGFLYS